MPKTTNMTGGDSYLKLVRLFSLRPIRRKAQYAEANRVYSALLPRADSTTDTGELDYIEVLGNLIRDYDETHASILKETVTPIEALKYLMQEHHLNTTQLGELLGSGSGQASMILNGKRELSKANIRVLAERFKVSAALFI
jgi:antitoxin component HigA of HigAB toxin-antitoxin module